MYCHNLCEYCRKNWRFVLGIAGAVALLIAITLLIIIGRVDWREPEPEPEEPTLREGRWDALRRIPERTVWMARLAEALIEARERDPASMTALMEAAPPRSALAAVAPSVREAFTEPLHWAGHEADVMAEWVPMLFGDGAGLNEALDRYGILKDSPAALFVEAASEGFSAALVLACEDFGTFVQAFARSLGADDGLEPDPGQNGSVHLPGDWAALDASPWVVLGRDNDWLDAVEQRLVWARRDAPDSVTEPAPGAWAVRVQASQLAASPLPSWLKLMLGQAIPESAPHAFSPVTPPLQEHRASEPAWAYLRFGLEEMVFERFPADRESAARFENSAPITLTLVPGAMRALLRQTLLNGVAAHDDPLTLHHMDRIAQALTGPIQLRIHETAEGPALTITAQVEDGGAVVDGLRWLLPPAPGENEGVDDLITVRESGHTFYILASPTVVHLSTDYTSAMTVDRDFLEHDHKPSLYFDGEAAQELLSRMRESGEGEFLSPLLDALSALADRAAQIRYHADPRTGQSFIAITRSPS